jgi:hypothetical protein
MTIECPWRTIIAAALFGVGAAGLIGPPEARAFTLIEMAPAWVMGPEFVTTGQSVQICATNWHSGKETVKFALVNAADASEIIADKTAILDSLGGSCLAVTLSPNATAKDVIGVVQATDKNALPYIETSVETLDGNENVLQHIGAYLLPAVQ